MSEQSLVPTLTAPPVTPDQLDLVKRTIASGASDSELKLYLYDCARQGVHPLDRLLHFTKRGGKYTPVTSIDLMRTRAADTGEYAGSDDATFLELEDGLPPEKATVTVWRLVQGQRCPFTATARWMEYCPPSGQDMMWRKMSHTMLAKCAEALALRKGFPRQLAGLYAREELDQAQTLDVAPTPQPTEIQPQAKAPQAVETATAIPRPMAGAMISDAQAKRLFAISKSSGWSTEKLKSWLLAEHGISSTKDIKKSQYAAICEAIERPVQANAELTANDVFGTPAPIVEGNEDIF